MDRIILVTTCTGCCIAVMEYILIVDGLYAVWMHRWGSSRLQVGAAYKLRREPENRWDSNAIAVYPGQGICITTDPGAWRGWPDDGNLPQSQRKNLRSCLGARGRGNVPRLNLKFAVRQHMSFARLCWTMVYYWDNDVTLQYHSRFPPRFWTIWFPDYLPHWSIE